MYTPHVQYLLSYLKNSNLYPIVPEVTYLNVIPLKIYVTSNIKFDGNFVFIPPKK